MTPHFHQLDVNQESSLKAFANHLQEEYGGVDIVLSNAAARIVKDVPQAEQVAGFIQTNNHGTHRVLNVFTPLIKDNARLVVVASSFGRLKHLAPSLHHYFKINEITLEDIARVMDDYVTAVQDGTAEARGWPEWINIASKIGQVAAIKVVAREQKEVFAHKGILVNAVCPGLIDTEASRPWFADMSQAQSPDEAARDVLWLSTLPPSTEHPDGELVQYRKILTF